MRSTISWVVLSVVVASASACKKEPSTPPQPTSSAAEPAPSAEVVIPATWSDDMAKEQKVAFMKKKVVPATAPVFQAQDPEAKAFGCKSCHGPEMKDPQEFLPKLTMKDGKITSFADKPEVSKFMMEKVVPAMASAMGMQPFDPATKQGFGCGGCHAVDMQ